MSVVVQFLCGYRTLPLYALVTQMGSGIKKAVFTESVAKCLKNWHYKARRCLSKNRSPSTEHSFKSSPSSTTVTYPSSLQPRVISLLEERLSTCHQVIGKRIIYCIRIIRPPSEEIIEEAVQNSCTPEPAITSISTTEITKEEAKHKIITGGTYDGEISFWSSWKKLENGNGIGETTSIIIEEDASDISTDFSEQYINTS